MKRFFCFVIYAGIILLGIACDKEPGPEANVTGMTMTTSASRVHFTLNGNEKATIHWGDGKKEEQILRAGAGISDFYFSHDYSGSVTSHTITIIGDNITNLDCSNFISITRGFETTNYICNNQLTSLDVSKNTELTSLNCHYNQLTSLDISKNTELLSLDCSNNQLTNLDTSNNMKLTSLNCIGNQLTSLDVNKNTDLIVLSSSNNPLISIDISNNTKLTFLSCGGNQLTNLDVNNNTDLKYLGCSNNLLSISALNALFGTLHNNASNNQKTVYIGGNPGTDDCDVKIAENKGWEVVKE